MNMATLPNQCRDKECVFCPYYMHVHMSVILGISCKVKLLKKSDIFTVTGHGAGRMEDSQRKEEKI
jgi:hypothetical protein